MSAPSEATAYGAAWDLSVGLSVLRARASKLGSALEPVAHISLETIASVMVGVDAWMTALAVGDLESPARHGTPAVTALARLLTRATGQELTSADLDHLALPTTDSASRAARYAAWVRSVGLDVAEVLRTAADDLGHGLGNPQLAQMAAALASEAEAAG